tara:strand:- start:400 stop:678 length:279 start_codon:yes stop_codon:yes gene_type:complete
MANKEFKNIYIVILNEEEDYDDLVEQFIKETVNLDVEIKSFDLIDSGILLVQSDFETIERIKSLSFIESIEKNRTFGVNPQEAFKKPKKLKL